MRLSSENLTNDFWGGLAAMLVALPSSMAFGIMVYTNFGSQYSGLGAMTGLLGAAALGIATPWIGRTKGLISAPCAPAAAVLTSFICGLIAGTTGEKFTVDAIFPMMAMVTLMAALLQMSYGFLGGGKLIKFIPYQVVTGYLSSVGAIIALGQLPKFLGLAKGTSLMEGLLQPSLWQWPSVTVGIVTIGMMLVAPKITTKIPAAIIALASGIVVFFLLGLIQPSLVTLEHNDLIIGPIRADGSLFSMAKTQFKNFAGFQLSELKILFVPAVTLSVLLSIDTLKTCVGLDSITGLRHNSNRELIGQGCGNLLSSMIGGMPGAGTMGPTLVNISSGGKTMLAGSIEGILVLLSFLFLGPLIAWVPIGALAGILLVIAWRMFDKSIFHLLQHKSGRLDFLVIVTVILVALFGDLIAASGTGILLSIFLFIRDQIQTPVLLKKLKLGEVSSKTQRSSKQKGLLRDMHEFATICKLQGNLFFGTTDQLFTLLDADLKSSKYILFDMRRVQSIDYTGVHLFEQMQKTLVSKGGQLLLCGMPSGLYNQQDFERYLKNMGLVSFGVVIYETFDSALEWIEDRALESIGALEKMQDQPLQLNQFPIFRQLSNEELASLASVAKEKSFAKGEKIFSHGVSGDEIFLVRKGSVKVLLPLRGGKYHHLTSVSQGDFFGELAFLDKGIRSADVEAKEPTELYIVSRSDFNVRSKADPVLGVQIFARLAHTIGMRLRDADCELSALEDR